MNYFNTSFYIIINNILYVLKYTMNNKISIWNQYLFRASKLYSIHIYLTKLYHT